MRDPDIGGGPGYRAGEVVGSQCNYCRHRIAGLTPTCTAFPGAIPAEILDNKFDHRLPHPDETPESRELGMARLELSEDVSEHQAGRLFDVLDRLRAVYHQAAPSASGGR